LEVVPYSVDLAPSDFQPLGPYKTLYVDVASDPTRR